MFRAARPAAPAVAHRHRFSPIVAIQSLFPSPSQLPPALPLIDCLAPRRRSQHTPTYTPPRVCSPPKRHTHLSIAFSLSSFLFFINYYFCYTLLPIGIPQLINNNVVRKGHQGQQ